MAETAGVDDDRGPVGACRMDQVDQLILAVRLVTFRRQPVAVGGVLAQHLDIGERDIEDRPTVPGPQLGGAPVGD